MVSSKPEAFPVLLVCSWNVKLPNVHREMLATRELCLAGTVGDLLAAALRASRSMWSLRYSFGEALEDQPFPQGVTQTYMHDSKPEPSQMCRKYMPEMTRTFCDDEDIRQTPWTTPASTARTCTTSCRVQPIVLIFFGMCTCTSMGASILTSSAR